MCCVIAKREIREFKDKVEEGGKAADLAPSTGAENNVPDSVRGTFVVCVGGEGLCLRPRYISELYLQPIYIVMLNA